MVDISHMNDSLHWQLKRVNRKTRMVFGKKCRDWIKIKYMKDEDFVVWGIY